MALLDLGMVARLQGSMQDALLGVILAALIVGAAMLVHVPTEFRIFGYPGLAMIFFLIAAAGGVALAVSILINDQKKPRRTPTP